MAEAGAPVADAVASVHPMVLLADAMSNLPGVSNARVEKGEIVLDVARDALLSVMMQLRDDPNYAFEQMIDLAGVDWPERKQRFDVVYNLLSCR